MRPDAFSGNKATLLLIAILLLQFILLATLLSQRPFPDEGRYLTEAWMILQGKVPGLDMFNPKPLATSLLLTGLFRIFGPSLLAARLFVAAIALAQVVLIFLIGKRMFNQQAALLASLFFALWSVPFSAYWAVIEPFIALSATLALFSLYLALSTRGKKSYLFAFGFFLGLGPVFKQTMLFFAIAALGTYILISLTGQRRVRGRANHAAVAAGLVAVPLAYMLYLSATSALEALNQSIFFPAKMATSFLVFNLDQRFAIAAAAFSAVAVLIILALKRSQALANKRMEFTLLFLWFIFALANALPFRACCFHLLPALPPASIIAGFVLHRGLKLRGGIPLFLFSALLIIASVGSALYVQTQLTSKDYSFESIEELAETIASLTNEGDTIVVFPGSPEMHFLAQRAPGAKQFIFLDPCDSSCQSGIIDDLRERKPELVIYFEASGEQPQDRWAEIDKFVQQNYELLEKKQLEQPLYKTYSHAFIYRKKQ